MNAGILGVNEGGLTRPHPLLDLPRARDSLLRPCLSLTLGHSLFEGWGGSAGSGS